MGKKSSKSAAKKANGTTKTIVNPSISSQKRAKNGKTNAKSSKNRAKSMNLAQKSANSNNQGSKITKIDKNGKKVVDRAIIKVPEVTSKRKNFRKIAWLIGVIAALILAVGAGVGVAMLSHHKEEPEISEVEPEPEEPEEPEEPKPEVNEDPLEPEPEISNNSNYKVPANKPRYLSIPSIGLSNIPVTEVQINSDGALGAPKSDYVVAWYYRSALPGQPGATVITGHGGDLGTGILKKLPRVPMGGEIIIEMGDGRKFTYVIEEITNKKIGHDADSYMDVIYKPLRPGSATLTLITCTGKWLPNQRTYDLRLFVRATLK